MLWDERNRTHVRRARSVRHQAAVLRVARRHALFRLGGEGAVRGRRAGALGRRVRVSTRSNSAAIRSRTLYDGVFQVPPGHYLLATDRHVQLHRYWDFNYPAADARRVRAPDAEYVAEFRHALDEAVRLRLRADVPVGCYLSGGLDSCAVLGLAARHHPEPIRAFTLTFDRADYDEEAEAREMAAQAGAEFHPIPIRQDDLADHFADAMHAVRDVLHQRARRREIPA